MSEDKARERIRKLLNITEANGASEAEAQYALEQIQILQTKYGLEDEAFGSDSPDEDPIIKRMADKEVKVYEDFVAGAAATLNVCKYIRHVRRNDAYGRPLKYPKLLGYVFVGLPNHIDAAEVTLKWLLKQLDYFYKITIPDEVKAQSPTAVAHWRYSFKEGCATRIQERVQELMRTPSKDLVAATGSSAVVIQGYWDRLRANNNRIASERFNLSRGQLMGGGPGYNVGRSAGDKVRLRQELDATHSTPLPPQQLRLTKR